MGRTFIKKLSKKIYNFYCNSFRKKKKLGPCTSFCVCRCCGKFIDRSEAFNTEYYYVCSSVCKDMYFNNKNYFYNNIIHRREYLEEWLSTKEIEIKRKVYKDKIKQRLESI